jgi:hypothetical protein
MKKFILVLFSLSLLVLITPTNDVNNQSSNDVALSSPKAAEPIYPPVG